MKRIAVTAIFLQLLLLTACAVNISKISETALVFDKNGGITNVIVESFTEDYYSIEALTAFFNEKVDDFKVQNIDAGDVSISEITVENGVAKAVLNFEDAAVYSDFYGKGTFYGTVNEAYDSGYMLNVTLKSIDSPETITKDDIMQMRDNMMIIVSDPVLVKSPRKILYASANVEVIDNKNVRISSDSTGFAYLLLE